MLNFEDVFSKRDDEIIKLENVFSKRHHEELTRVLFSNDFPWYYSPHTSKFREEYGAGVIMNEHVTDSSQFNHVFFYGGDMKTSPLFELVAPLICILEKEMNKNYGITRIKSNMLMKDGTYPLDNYNTPHVDWNPPNRNKEDKHLSFLYYLNDSDGDTYLFNEYYQETPEQLTIKTRNTPKANTGILFNSDNYHASSPPRETTARVVINYVFKELP